MKKITLQALCGILLLTGLYFFCASQTKGFRFYQLLSSIPNDARWDTPALTDKEKDQIDHLLDQTFTFLGKGGFCCAFLGEDQKTVLKFYSHTHLSPMSVVKHFSWEKLLLKGPVDFAALSPFLEFAFKSCKLLFTQAKERTGLIYIHLNKSHELRSPVTVIDPLGIRHEIDLNQTEFVLQHKAEMLIDHIAHAVIEQKMENAKRAIDSYLDCLLTLCRLGARDLDHGFRNNYGILDDGTVITMDISSFTKDDCLQRPGVYKKEIVLKSHNLAKWLKKHHPDLYIYYDEKLVHLIEKE